MAKMRKCKYCGMEMPNSAKRCPSCNKKVKRPVVTALCTLIILLALFLIIVIVSSPSDSESITSSSPNSTSAAESSEQSKESATEMALADDDVIYAEFLGFEDHPELECFFVNLRVTNKTGQKIWVYLDEASVNDEMMQLVMSGVPLNILPEKKGSNSFMFYYKQTSIESFEDVKTVSFKICVKNEETLTDIETTEEVTIER